MHRICWRLFWELNGGVDFGERRGAGARVTLNSTVALTLGCEGDLEFELNGGVDFGERMGCMRVTLSSTVALALGVTFEFPWNKQNNSLH